MNEETQVQEAIVVQRPVTDIVVARDPEVVLNEAHKAAKALKSVIDAKPNKVMFNDEVYLEYEDWLTVAKFYGVTARIREVKYVEYGNVRGFEAFAEALLVAKDQVISSADSMCLNDEANWSTRAKYEWHYALKAGGTAKEAETTDMIWEPNPSKPGKNRPKRIKVKVSDEPVPLFQLRSMAQTRACAKALRNVLAWVVVLAGYKPTPAEEMTQATTHEVVLVNGKIVDANTKEAQEAVKEAKIEGMQANANDDIFSQRHEALKQESQAKKQSAPPIATTDGPFISEKQAGRVYAIWKSHGWDDKEAHARIKEGWGLTSTKDIRRGKQYDQICEYFEQTAAPPLVDENGERLPF